MRWKNSSIYFSLISLTLVGLFWGPGLAYGWKDEEDIDFEFDDISQEKNDNGIDDKGGKNLDKWNKNAFCKNVHCQPHQTCVVKSENLAVCMSKKKLRLAGTGYKTVQSNSKLSTNQTPKNYQDEDEEDPQNWPDSASSCEPCPVVKPDFVCASDNQTYSSECRMNYHNCVHKTNYAILCKGFCPCKDQKSDADYQKEEKMKERWNSYMSKFQNTLNKMKWEKTTESSVTTVSTVDKNNKSYRVNFKNKTTGLSSNGSTKNHRKKTCTKEDLKMMGDRLLDWFSVVMSDHQKPHSRRRNPSNSTNFKAPVCKPEVKWMFQHLDSNGDTKLSLRELYDLEHDDREHCLQPYLSDCDSSRDLFLSIREWCACFEKSKRPCIAAQERSPEGMVGAYTPQCDEDGYYHPRQCHNSIGMCWCVDKHGVEFTNTRRRGYPDCASLLKRGHHKSQSEDDEDDSEEDSYEDQEGSADKPLDF